MSDSLGSVELRLAMSDFIGSARFIVPGQGSGSLRAQGATGTVLTFSPGTPLLGGLSGVGVRSSVAPKCLLGKTDDRFDDGDVWFDLAIVRPPVIAFGNILSTQNADITVYSSFRLQTINLTSVVNNLGTGASLLGLPAIPIALDPQSGFETTLEVTTDGPPTIDDTIDFVFDVGTQTVSVTGKRIVVLLIPPEAPLREILEFMTSVLEHIDGSEQRIANRKNPRQIFELQFAVDGTDRQFLANFLYDWQPRVFGIPIWTDPAFLTTVANVSDTVLNVDDTTLSDFRVGGQLVIFTDRFTFDAVTVATINPTSITFTSPLTNSYPIGTGVYPLRTAIATQTISASRALVNDENIRIRFRVLDNDVGDGFGDVSAFNSLNSRVLLDGPNASDGRMVEALVRKLVEFDGLTGIQSVTSTWSRGRRSSIKGFVTHSRQELMDVRKLLHALRGRQVAFYLPTFFDEFELTLPLGSGGVVLNIVNVGFSSFAKQRGPSRGILRVVQTDGTILTRNITSSGELDPENEQIIVDVAWPNEILISDIARIEYVELVRADTDRFLIEHTNAIGDAKVSFPVKAVFD